MGKVLAGACGACGTAVVAREATGTGQSESGEAGRQATEVSGGPGLRRPTGLGRKARRGVGCGEPQGSADGAATASRRLDPVQSAVVRCCPGAPPLLCLQPFGPALLFEHELQASPPDSVTLLGPRGSVASHFCVPRAGSRAWGSLLFPILASDTLLHFLSGVPKSIAPCPGLRGNLLCPPRYPCLLPSSFLHPFSLFPSLSLPFPVAWSLSVLRFPIIFVAVSLGFFSPVLACPVYLSLSYPGSSPTSHLHQRVCFCPSP